MVIQKGMELVRTFTILHIIGYYVTKNYAIKFLGLFQE